MNESIYPVLTQRAGGWHLCCRSVPVGGDPFSLGVVSGGFLLGRMKQTRPEPSSDCAMQEAINSRIRPADLQESLRDEEMAAPSRTRLLAERALSPFFAPESADSSTDAQPRRLVRRDSAFHQSSGKINMHRGLRADRLLGLAKRDWYHVLLSMKSRSLLLIITCTFTFVVVFYALMFMLADHSLQGCGIAPRGQRASFYNAFAVRVRVRVVLGLELQG